MVEGKRGSVRLSTMDRSYLELVVEEDEDAMNDPSTILNWTQMNESWNEDGLRTQEEHTIF